MEPNLNCRAESTLGDLGSEWNFELPKSDKPGYEKLPKVLPRRGEVFLYSIHFKGLVGDNIRLHYDCISQVLTV